RRGEEERGQPAPERQGGAARVGPDNSFNTRSQTGRRQQAMELMKHFQDGGWGMYPILAIFALTVGIIVDRAMYLAKSKVDVDKLMSLLKSQIVAGNVRGAINTCEASPAPVTRIIAAGLRPAGGSEPQVQ